MTFVLPRPPRTDDELWWVIKAMFGVELPRVKVCADHVSPFDAVAHAYFGRSPNYAVWYASRGSGKSLALAVLGLTKAFVRDIDVTILGGSMTQSLNVREHMRKLMAAKNAPSYAMAKDQATLIQMNTGKAIKPLPASQTTVRGPHPPLQLLDEVDEMEWDIYNASLGQAMEQLNAHGEVIEEYIVASSTWQNPEGCVLVGTLVTTKRGQVPIEQVVIGDEVPTREGWRRVSNVINTGIQECVKVSFASGRQLVCTPWHPVWTNHGWIEASLLTPGLHVGVHMGPVGLPVTGLPAVHTESASPDLLAGLVDPDQQGPLHGEVVSVLAHDGSGHRAATKIVDRGRDWLEVTGIDARSAGAAASADMVDLQTVRDGSDDLLVDPTVSQDVTRATGNASSALLPVPVLLDVAGPDDAVVGVQVDGFATEHDEVVNVSHCVTLLPTWDLTVEDCHEYVAGGILVHNTFTQVIETARERGLPVFTWCWRELLQPHGWMSQRFIDNKRQTVSAQMWHTEYDLNEPSAGSRALDLDKVERYFIDYPATVAELHQGNGDHDVYVWEKPERGGLYAVGADWAKEQDKTVIAVVRYDVKPHRLVKLTRINRRPWDTMIAMFNKDTQDYHAIAEHDGTGVGNVVNDFLDYSDTTAKFVMVGRPRTQMLLDYITAFEHGRYELPKIGKNLQHPGVVVNPLYRAHRAVTVADVYAPGKWNSHLPDDFAAMALAHRAIEKIPAPITTETGVGRSPEPRRVDAPFHVTPEGNTTVSIGGVTIVDERYGFTEGGLMVPADSRDPWEAMSV